MKIEKNIRDEKSRQIEYSVQCLLPRLNQPCKGSLVNMQLKQVALGITQRLNSIFGSNAKDHHSMIFSGKKIRRGISSLHSLHGQNCQKSCFYILT